MRKLKQKKYKKEHCKKQYIELNTTQHKQTTKNVMDLSHLLTLEYETRWAYSTAPRSK